jgi:DNA adenine methylase
MTTATDTLEAPARPVLRYHGGKWLLAPWLMTLFPKHRVYVEPFGGGASVLLRKERSYSEVYNELDGEIVNVFRVARDHGAAFQQLLALTPFSRDEFIAAHAPTDDPIERARRTVIRSFMGFGSNSIQRASGFRANSNRSGTTPAHDWANYSDVFGNLVERLRGVVIENRDALDVLTTHDSTETLFYVDPPYVSTTRDKGADYRFEMDDAAHAKLAERLKGLRGYVVLSGYACDLYDRELFTEWPRFERKHLADGARVRTEVVWINPACAAALEQQRAQLGMFP